MMFVLLNTSMIKFEKNFLIVPRKVFHSTINGSLGKRPPCLFDLLPIDNRTAEMDHRMQESHHYNTHQPGTTCFPILNNCLT